MKENQKKLESLLIEPYFTKKLSALPRTVPDDIWLSGYTLSAPYNFENKQNTVSLVIEGVASSLSGNKEELALGKKFTTDISDDLDYADLCKNSATIAYNVDNSLKSKGGAFVLGTKFTIKCGK